MMDNNREEYETQCHDCPYFDPEGSVKDCTEELRNDILSILMEKEKGRSQ